MQVITLQSGSNGNCIYIEAAGVRLLIDAGISGRQAELRLAAHGRDIRACHALLISHDHSDHVRSAGIFQRKFGLPVYVTQRTLEAACRWCRLGRLTDVRHFAAGNPFELGDLRVETIPTAHDGVEGVGFVLDDGRRRLGVLTDLGHVFPGLADVVATLDAVVLESNYDPQMLFSGSYPEHLQRRIAGPNGHLSNFEAADLLYQADGRLQWACLAHLSEENNRPQLAIDTHRRRLADRFPLFLASRHDAAGPFAVHRRHGCANSPAGL